jgi:molybdopterin molybdotransferase
MLTVEQARRLILEPLRPLSAETVAVKAALGRVLAAPVRAADPAPPFDASEMDGFAIRTADCAETPARLHVALALFAGAAPAARALGPGEAARIMTGAPVPSGADAVVPREAAREEGATIEVLHRPAPGAFIRRRGSDYEAGEEVLAAGARLSPAALALAVSAGAAEVEVRRRPRVAILSTGDELLSPGEPLRPGTIRESNRFAIAGLVSAVGGEPLDLGIARDRADEIAETLRRGLASADAAITIGGVSVGDRDLVRAALAAIGVESRFFRVALRPGKPVTFGMHGEKPVFALPGNPASAFVACHLFVLPALRRLEGLARVEPFSVTATLEAPVRGLPDRRSYLRARLQAKESGLTVRAAENQASGALRPLAEANALLLVPEGVAELPKGAPVRVEPLDWPEGGDL